MKYFIALLSLLISPFSVHAEEISFLVETTYASSEAEVAPTVLPVAPVQNAGNSRRVQLIKETPPSAVVPVAAPVVESSVSSTSTSESSEPALPTHVPVQDYTAKEQEELDHLTLEQLEEYADEATVNLEEQLAQLEAGFTVMNTSIMGNPLSPTQRAAILRRSIRTVAQLKIFTQALTEFDANLRQVKISDKRIEISYRQKAKLFGLIPLNYLLKTTVEDGDVQVKQPWWHFLARDDVKTYKEELQQQLDLLGDLDAEDPDFEENLKRKQQILQTISNVSKILHDTAMNDEA